LRAVVPGARRRRRPARVTARAARGRRGPGDGPARAAASRRHLARRPGTRVVGRQCHLPARICPSRAVRVPSGAVRSRARGAPSDQRGPPMSSSYPYAETHDVIRGMPSEGRSRDSIIAELTDFARREDATWETGKCSGTMYCGAPGHSAFMGRAFELFAHVNALQRDMCPSMTKFEGEIIAMTLDLLNASAVTDTETAGLVTSGGSGSILHAVLAYREYAAQTRGITQPNFVKPETAHPAFDKACHLLGVECRRVPVVPDTTLADP